MDFQLSDYHRALVRTTREFATAHFAQDAYAYREDTNFPREYLPIIAAQGLAGITIPEADGGQGGSLLDAVLVIETMAMISPAAGDAVQALNFGAIQQLARNASPALKAKYLTPAIQGQKVMSIGMSEPDAGSAVTDLKTRARIDGDTVVINGQKVFNTNGDIVDLVVVWVRFGDDVRSSGAVLVDRDAPGFSIDANHRFMSGERYGILHFDDCRVPLENILVPDNGFGRLLSVFNVERLGNSSRSLALGQAAFDMGVAYAKERRQFSRRLAEFQGLQWRFAEMKIKLEAARLLLYRAAANADSGLPSELETSMAKIACNRAGFEVANDILQIFGGYGYDIEAPVNYIFRRTRGWMIAGGAIEQLLNRVAGEVFGESFSQRPPRPSS